MLDPPQPPLEIVVPDKVADGVYANGFGVWHTKTDFTVDFLTMIPGGAALDPEGQVMTDADGNRQQKIVGRVVARVKIPTPLIFQLIKSINDNMTLYEATIGELPTLPGTEPAIPPGDPPPGQP